MGQSINFRFSSYIHNKDNYKNKLDLSCRELLIDPVNRRNFLTTTAKFAGFAALVSPLDLVARKGPDFHHLALISDTHIPADENESYRNFFPTKNFQKIVGEVLSTKPEASIINGDLARLTGEKN